jgi:hypothetical protein
MKTISIFKRLATNLILVVALIAGASTARAQTGNPVQVENARPGSTGWQISNPTTSPGQIEGYASAPSINRGGQITFYVNTTDPTYTLQVFRLGYYQGLGGRAETQPIQLTGSSQTVPAPDPVTGIVDCNWTPAYTLTANNPNDPTDWVSGYYVALLTGNTSGLQRYIPFVVRDDSRKSALLFQSSFNTSEAYNAWGGKSLYTYNSTQGIAAVKVSLNRPFDDGMGTGTFLSYEFDMLSYLEQQGYDVSYAADLDIHLNPSNLFQHKALLDVGHGEYWSWEMRQNVTAALNAGVNLGFFGANMMYWQIRYEASPATGQSNRVIVCYKTLADAEDPMASNPSTYYLITDEWRNFKISYPGLPEAQIIGEMYNGQEPMSVPVVVTSASNWVFAGTGLANGGSLNGLQGYEADQIYPGISPANVTQLAHSPYVLNGTTYYSDMSTYQASSGATVFATGSMYFQWGLSSMSPWGPTSSLVNTKAQTIVNNVLTAFINSSGSGSAGGTPTPTPTPGPISLRGVEIGGTTGAAASVTVSVPTGVQPGDVLIAQLAVRGGSSQAIVAPNGWSLVRRDNSGTTLAQAIYSHVVPWWPSEPSAYTWTFNGGNNAGGAIAAYIGVSNSTPVDVSNGANANSSSIVAPSVSIPAADTSDQLLNMFGISNVTGIFLPPTTTPEYGFMPSSGGLTIGMSDSSLGVGGATSSQTATAYSSGANTGAQIALLPGPIAPEPAIFLRGVGTGSTATAGSSVVVTVPTGTQPNDLLLAQIAIRGGSALTIGVPAGWTLVRRDNSGTTITQAIYSHVVPASPAEPASYTWTFNAGNDATGGIADYFEAGTISIDASNGVGAAASTTITAPPVVIPSGNNTDRLVCFFATAGGVAPTPSSGTTQQWSFRAVAYGIGQAMSDIAVQPSGQTPAESATVTTAYANVGATVALH